MAEEEVDQHRTGVCVTVSIVRADMHTFRLRYQCLFRYLTYWMNHHVARRSRFSQPSAPR